ncbi:MAG: hypothetical protein ACK4VO_04665 [Pseudobdellovibrio sp.]
MQILLSLILLVLTFNQVQASELKTLICERASLKIPMVAIQVNDKDQLVGLKDLSLAMGLKSRNPDKFVDIRSSVTLDHFGRQQVYIGRQMAEDHYLHISLKDKHAFIAVWDHDWRQYTEIIDLDCK